MSGWISEFMGRTGYFGLGALMFAETIFPPIPSEVIMPLAGVAAAEGRLSVVGAVLAGSAGAMAGNTALYALARTLGTTRLRKIINRFGRWLTLHWSDVEQGQQLFEHRGALYVCLGRMIPFVRSVVSIPAGLLGMAWAPFLVWSSVGSLGWTGLLTYAGYLLGQRYDRVNAVLHPIAVAAVVVIAAAYLVRLVLWRPADGRRS